MTDKIIQKRMKNRLAHILFGCAVLSPLPAAAQDCSVEKAATLPITFVSFLPTVPVTINGTEAQIGIDTGAQRTILSQSAAARLELPPAPTSSRITGSSGTNVVKNVTVDSFDFAGSSYGAMTMPAIAIAPAKPAGDNPDEPGNGLDDVAGLIGTDILSAYDIEYDAPGQTLTLYRVTDCQSVTPSWNGRYIKMPAQISASKHFILPVGLDGKVMTAIFDTGASSEKLAVQSERLAGLTPDMLAQDPQHEGSGIGGYVYKSPTHRFSLMQIGNEKFRNPLIGLADFSAQESDMLIGEDYMRNRRFWLSYATSMVFEQTIR